MINRETLFQILPGKNCSIINTASISGHIGQVHRWTYSSTKGAILSLTRCMAVDLREKEIRVNSVSPGWVWTPEVSYDISMSTVVAVSFMTIFPHKREKTEIYYS